MTRKEIYKYVWKWQQILGLHNWDIAIYFGQPPKKGKKDVSPNTPWHADDTWQPIASIDVHPMYKMASIYFDVRKLKRLREETIVHELVHCFTEQLDSYHRVNAVPGDKAERWHDYFNEQLVSELTAVMIRLKRAAEK